MTQTPLFDENGMPTFDKARLLSDEFKPYHYSLEFRNRSVLDMRVGGYQKAIRPYQDGGHVAEHLATHVMGSTIYCQVAVSIPLLSGKVFMALGDADNRGTPDGDTCLRTAESVAFKRAVCKALDISPIDFGMISDMYDADGKIALRSARGRGDRATREPRDALKPPVPPLPQRVADEPRDPPKGGLWGKCRS